MSCTRRAASATLLSKYSIDYIKKIDCRNARILLLPEIKQCSNQAMAFFGSKLQRPVESQRSGSEGRLREFFVRIGRVVMNKPRARNFCVYVAGLLSSLDRKTCESVAVAATTDTAEPAVRTGGDHQSVFRHVKRCHQRILHTIGKAKWNDTAVRDEAVRVALESLPDDEPIEQLIIDDTGFIKQGAHSVGVKRQYTGSAGKKTNCQVGVSVVACTATSQFPVDFALYLPHEWLTPKARAHARIPASVVFKTKPELAAEMVDRILDTGLLPVCRVSADSDYGRSTEFRKALLRHGCPLAVGVRGDANAWSVDVRGSRRGPATSLEAISERLKYRRVVWRNGTKGKMSGLFGARRVVMKNGFDPEEQADPLWLVAEKAGEELKYYLASGGPDASLKELVGVLKQRFRTERSYQDAKNEVGLADYQGRSFVGWHHHVTAAIAACAFLFSEQRHIPKTPNTSARRESVRTSTRLLRHFPESFSTLRRALATVLRFALPGGPCLNFA